MAKAKLDRPETPTDRRRAERERDDRESKLEQMRVNALYAAVFDTAEGKELLAQWWANIIERPTPSDISDGALQRLEANRNFVRVVKARVDEYHKAPKQA